jgi:OOP family OmpA-OmpF porin
MKKIIVLMLSAALCLAMSLPSLALELTPDAAAKIHKSPTAYSPDTFNAILEAAGLRLEAAAVSGIPASYAKVSDGNIVFGKKPTAYRPSELHAILTAYGLTLSPEEVNAELGATNYAKVVDGNIVFGKEPAAYGGETLAAILGAYMLPQAPAPEPAPAPAPAPSPAPIPAPAPAPAPEGPGDADGDGVTDDIDQCPRTPAGARVDSRGCWILHNYLFDFDKAILKSQYHSDLDDVARVLRNNPTVRVEIQGHTDSIGTAKYNQRLSERRARAVEVYLMNSGIESSRLTVRGFGETTPADTNATRAGRANNRRVELKPIW